MPYRFCRNRVEIESLFPLLSSVKIWAVRKLNRRKRRQRRFPRGLLDQALCFLRYLLFKSVPSGPNRPLLLSPLLGTDGQQDSNPAMGARPQCFVRLPVCISYCDAFNSGPQNGAYTNGVTLSLPLCRI